MADVPLGSFVVVEQLGTGHEEDAPALPPQRRIGLTVAVRQYGQDVLLIGIHLFEPCIACPGVMPPVPMPAVLDPEMIGKAQWQVSCRHDAASEKVTAHPVCRPLVDVLVGCRLVAEDMHEEFAVRNQPPADAAKQLAVIAHVFEHLYRNHAIKSLVDIEVVHIADDDIDIADGTVRGLLQDKVVLRRRI